MPPSFGSNSTTPFLTRVPWWRQIRVRVTATLAGLVLFVAGALFFTNWQIRRAAVLKEFQDWVVSVGALGVVALDGDAIALIEIEADALTPEFDFARRQLQRIREIKGISEEEIYVLRPVPEGGEYVAEFVVMTHAEPFVGSRYTIRPENRMAYRAALAEARTTYTAIYEDEHGTWISAYAPIVDGGGRVTALLEVDREISRFEAALAREFRIEAVVTMAALLAALGPAFYLGNRLTQGARNLAREMKRFEGGDMQARVELGSGDEIAGMAEGFNRMAQSVGERLQLLPFVSQFTARAVEKSRTVETWLEGTEREVVILITDVRGFTAASSMLKPAELVESLNSLLTLQTEVIVSHGGDIDKFMGDAVLAVWPAEGDGLERAARCALALQARMGETRPAWGTRAEAGAAAVMREVALGAALHWGTVVTGAVGSAARRDFTVIGHTVNVTAHLCATAGRGEVLVTPAAWERLPGALQTRFGRMKHVKLKHAADEMPVHCSG